MKKLIAVLLGMSMMMSMTACTITTDTGDSQQTTKPESNSNLGTGEFAGVTLEIAHRYVGHQLEEFEKLVDNFEEETGCAIQLSGYGDDYENTMKTRMASNTLPDIFQTHGWSILRYKEYLLDLQNEPWVSDLDESALGVVKDTDGAIYVLMTSQTANGTLVNLEVCEDAGVDPYAIRTWSDFEEACAKLKEAGYTPIGVSSGAGNFANIAGTWVSYEGALSQDSAAMLDGTYDWESYRPFLETMARWLDAGYFYDDYATIAADNAAERFAQNRSAFWIGNGAAFLLGCKELNPEGQYGFLPTFTSQEGGQMFVGIGEGDTFGVWKDSKNTEASKVFLEFMARPENAVALNASTGYISSLKSAMEIDETYALGLLTEMQEKFEGENILYENLWDRKYMPSGMWPIFGNVVQAFTEEHDQKGIDKAIEYLRDNYRDLYEAAQMK